MKDLKLSIKSQALLPLTVVSNFLTGQGVESYLVGGVLRDLLLERSTADIDITVKGDALEVAHKIATALGGKYVLLDGINRVGRVVLVNEEGRWELPGRLDVLPKVDLRRPSARDHAHHGHPRPGGSVSRVYRADRPLRAATERFAVRSQLLHCGCGAGDVSHAVPRHTQ